MATLSKEQADALRASADAKEALSSMSMNIKTGYPVPAGFKTPIVDADSANPRWNNGKPSDPHYYGNPVPVCIVDDETKPESGEAGQGY